MLTELGAALREAGEAPRPRAGPADPLERPEVFTLARLHEPVDLAHVACAAGTASRTLSHAFRARRNLVVIEWQRLRRLDRVHGGLARLDGEPRTVTEVGTRWGSPPPGACRRPTLGVSVSSRGRPCGAHELLLGFRTVSGSVARERRAQAEEERVDAAAGLAAHPKRHAAARERATAGARARRPSLGPPRSPR